MGIEVGYPVASVDCASRGSPPFRFRWLKDGKELMSSDRVIVRSFEKYSAVEISNVEAGDRGNYSCIVSNSAGSDSFTTVLDIKRLYLRYPIILMTAVSGCRASQTGGCTT